MKPLPPMFKAFLVENLKRLRQKSPTFFKWWNILANIGLVLHGIPWVITMVMDWLEYYPPGIVAFLSNKFVTGIATGMKVISMLTVESTTVGQTVEGSPVAVVDEKKLPFTAEQQKIEVTEKVPEPLVIPEVPLPSELPENQDKPGGGGD